MLSVVNQGWKFGVSFTISTGYLRQAAKKHYFTDVVSGAAIGFGISKICN